MSVATAHVAPGSAEEVGRALVAYIASRPECNGARMVESPTAIGSGFDSFIYAFRLEGHAVDRRWTVPLVLRLQGSPQAGDKVRREAAVHHFMMAAAYPVPALLAAEAGTENALGLPFMIMHRVAGSTMLGRITSNPLRAGRLLASLAEAHARLHRVSTVGWTHLENEPLVQRQLARFRDRIAEHGLSGLDAEMSWLERYAASVLPEQPVITHNDFHPLNVMVTPQGDLSVLDWTDASLGDRHHDVARTLTLFSFAYVAASSKIERVLLKAARGFLRSRYFRAYQAAFPVEAQKMAYFEAFQAFNGMLQILELARTSSDRPLTASAEPLLQQLPSLQSEAQAFVRARISKAERTLTDASA